MNPFVNPLGSVIDIIPAVMPLDLQTARAGDAISLKNAAGVLILVVKGAGTAGDDPDFTLYQQSDVANSLSDAKALNAIDVIWKKQGAALTAVGTWTKVEQTADEVFSADATSAEEQALYAIWVPATALDRDGGFDCIRLDVADVGNNAQLGCVLYILAGLRYPSDPANLPSAIID